jgi:hypothetical protein
MTAVTRKTGVILEGYTPPRQFPVISAQQAIEARLQAMESRISGASDL